MPPRPEPSATSPAGPRCARPSDGGGKRVSRSASTRRRAGPRHRCTGPQANRREQQRVHAHLASVRHRPAVRSHSPPDALTLSWAAHWPLLPSNTSATSNVTPDRGRAEPKSDSCPADIPKKFASETVQAKVSELKVPVYLHPRVAYVVNVPRGH